MQTDAALCRLAGNRRLPNTEARSLRQSRKRRSGKLFRHLCNACGRWCHLDIPHKIPFGLFMSLFYESIGRTTNNRLLLFVTVFLRLEPFGNTRQAEMITIMLARESLSAVTLRFIGHMEPAGIAIFCLWIFQN